MVENKSSLFGIIALIIGASGLGLGAFSVVNFQMIEGPEGPEGPSGEDGLDGIDGVDGINGTDGQDGIDGINGINGTDGQDAPGGLVVGILDPDSGEILRGDIIIRALIYGSEAYTISILRNGTKIGNSLPMTWDTTLEADDWYNISVIITDLATNNKSQDEVIVFVKNTVGTLTKFRVYRSTSYTMPAWQMHTVDFDTIMYNNGFTIDLTLDRFTVLKSGYYFISAQVTLENIGVSSSDLEIKVWRSTPGQYILFGSSSGSMPNYKISASCSDILWLPAGVFLYLESYQTVTGASVCTGDEYTYFSMVLIEG